MIKKISITTVIVFSLSLPFTTFALQMPQGSLAMPESQQLLKVPQNGNDLAEDLGINAAAYVVTDAQTGQALISKNANQPWTPASLTKLVTALVVLDTKPKLYKSVALTEVDQIAGWCKSGGACIAAKPGVAFSVDGLFHAALMPSANNAASALARSTGLTQAEFVVRMNNKIQVLGATNSHFNEPTGMDPSNQITASDYSKIVQAAFSNPYLKQIAGLSTYYLKSANNSKYNQTIKNTDKLVGDSDVELLGAKTGYLNESKYNFASLLKYNGQELAVVVLGENHLYTAFSETKLLASLAPQAQAIALYTAPPTGAVLGTSTVAVVN